MSWHLLSNKRDWLEKQSNSNHLQHVFQPDIQKWALWYKYPQNALTVVKWFINGNHLSKVFIFFNRNLSKNMCRYAGVLLWLLWNKSPPDGEIQLKQKIWAPSGVLSPHDLMQSEFGSGQIVNCKSQVFGQIRAGPSDWLSLMLSEFRSEKKTS